MDRSFTFRLLAARARHFLRSSRGTISVEAALILPLLAWVYVAMFTYFDAFRVRNTAEKAVYTVSDALTRVTDGVDENYIEGMKDLYEYLTFSSAPTVLRVSEIQWRKTNPSDPDNDSGNYWVTWSYGTDEQPMLTDEELAEMAAKIPNLNHGERLILVESDVSWTPVFNVGLSARNFDYFVPTAPRFATQVAWEGASVYLGVEETNEDDLVEEEDAPEGEDEDTTDAWWCRFWPWYC